MVEEIRKNIYRITVVLPDSPLKVLNSYFIRGNRRDILIDTGFRRPECQEALQRGLDELDSDPLRRDILITHLHSDHIGMADLFVGQDHCIYFEKQELEIEKSFLAGKGRTVSRMHYLEAGMSEELLDSIAPNNPASKFAPPEITDQFVGLPAYTRMEIGDYEIQIIPVPGHTPHNTMFWMKREGIMFTGDHILFDITPNICSWPQYSVPDSLGSYIQSLRLAAEFPVKVALPGHRESGDYHERIHTILEHHRVRLNDCMNIIHENPGMSAYDIAGLMRWKISAKNWDDFPMIQKWFAVGECMAHLDYLLMRGNIDREMKDGVWRYYENSGVTQLSRI